MSKLDELIQELCPEGVEYKTLGEIATNIFRGSGITRDQVTEDGIPCVRYGEIYTTYDVWFDSCVSHTDESKISNKKYFEHGDILFAITGESVEDIAKSCAYVGHERCLAGGDIVVLKHNQDPKYLGYALSTSDAREQKSKGKVKSKVVHSSVPSIKEIKIPVPPLEVQREIVRILDNFTELTAELTAELSARQQQYEYYRDMLVKFDGQIPGVENKRLSEICTFTRGTAITSKETTPGPVPVISGGLTPAFYHNEANRPSGTITVAGSGANAGFVSTWDVPIFCADSFSVDIKDATLMNPRFLFYVLKNKQDIISSSKKGGGVPHVHGSDIANITVPVPPIDVQQQVVSILDQFYTLSSDIGTGLPAEIAAREKQYEFFRDKILTFKGVTPPRMILALLIAAELIGVECKSLGQLEDEGSLTLGRGKVISKPYLVENPGDYPVYSSSVTNNGAIGCCSTYMFADERITWSIDGGGKFFYRAPHPYSVTNVCGWLKVDNTEAISTKYLFYVLSSEWTKKTFDYTHKAHPSVIRDEYTVPLPPLFIQQAIVNVLDKFESLCADLKEGLPAEIALRQRQYDYYRDALLALPACSH